MTRFVTMPLLLAGGAAAKVGADFDFMSRKVEAKVTVTSKSIKDLRNQAKELGRTTVHTAREVAGAQEKLAMAGWDSLEVFQALPNVLALSTATSTELIQTADIASNVMQAFALSTTESGRVADVFATIVAGANVDMEMLADTMKYVAPVAREFEMSLEDAAAASGFLGNMGIQGSLAGTALRTSLVNITAPSAKAKKLFKDMNLQLTDGAGNMRNFKDILGDMSAGLSDLTKPQKIAAIKEIFGKRAIAAALPMVGDVNTFNSSLRRLSTTLTEMKPGAAQKMVNIMTGGATGAFKRFTSALEGVAIAFAESGLLDSLASMADTLAKVFQEIAELNPETKKIILQVAMFAAALGPVLLIAGQVVGAIGGILGAIGAAGGLAALVALAAPIVVLAAKIGLVVAAIAFLWDELEPIRTAIQEGLGSAFSGVTPILEDAWEIIKDVGAIIKGLVGAIAPLVGWSVKWVMATNPLSVAFKILTKVLRPFVWLVKMFCKVARLVGKIIGDYWGPKFKEAGEGIGYLWDQLVGFLKPVKDAIKWVTDLGTGLGILAEKWIDKELGDEKELKKKVKVNTKFTGKFFADEGVREGMDDPFLFGLGEGADINKNINFKQKSEVNIRFANLPKGATVEKSGNVNISNADTGELIGDTL